MSMDHSGISASGGGLGRFPLEGNLSLRDASRVCDRLREAAQSYDPVEIDIGSLTGLDISIVQLLLAARKSAARRGRNFTLSGTLTEQVREFLAGVGLIEHQDADDAFWLGGGNTKRAA